MMSKNPDVRREDKKLQSFFGKNRNAPTGDFSEHNPSFRYLSRQKSVLQNGT
jgi:hypothetical protein